MRAETKLFSPPCKSKSAAVPFKPSPRVGNSQPNMLAPKNMALDSLVNHLKVVIMRKFARQLMGPWKPKWSVLSWY
jgi:hypothetical protein